MMKKIICTLLFGLISSVSQAATQSWCVFDPLNAQGEIGRSLKDIRLYAQLDQVQLKYQIFNTEQAAIQAFEKKQCSGLVASNFNTYRYNKFMGTTGGIGLIPNNQVARIFLQLLNHPNVEKRMIGTDFEAVGMIPVGTAYMMLNLEKINKMTQLKGKSIGILANNPPQLALVQSVGARPTYVDFSNALDLFKQNKMDVLTAPIYRILPYDLKKEFGSATQVYNFPLSYVAMNLVIRPESYPKGFGRHIRGWFVKNSTALTEQTTRWENHLPAYYWADLSEYEKQNYEAHVTKVRQRFVENGYYDAYLVELIKRLRCLDDPQYVECRK